VGLLNVFLHGGLNRDMNVLNLIHLLLILSCSGQTDEHIRAITNSGYLQNKSLHNQCFVSGSGFNKVSGSGSGSRRAKMTHKIEIPCFEVLDVLF
jgi:hypothetical protein